LQTQLPGGRVGLFSLPGASMAQGACGQDVLLVD
jgi:hypothetical protein